MANLPMTHPLRTAREHVAAALRLIDQLVVGDGGDPFPPDLPPARGTVRGDWDALPPGGAR